MEKETKEIYKRMALVMQEVKHVGKNQLNQHLKVSFSWYRRIYIMLFMSVFCKA